MSKFKFTGFADILHLNTRKEGQDDDKELAIDVKLRAKTGIDALAFFDNQLSEFLFLDSGAVRNEMMGPVTFNHELESYRLTAVGGNFYGVKVKKFSIEPADGNVINLTFSISFKPSGDEVARLAEYLQDAIEINIEPANEELGLEGEAA